MQLIIVESPTKARTITRFLNSGDFVVKSSYGHIRDLPKSKLGINIEHDFEPSYLIPAKAKKIVTELKHDASKADGIILATDPDREGEAIAWHLAHALGLDKKSNKQKVERVVFHEITKHAIQEAVEHPRDIDKNLVDAQQARRVLDRLVGYKLSPFLWKKIRSGLSAGRVQSVAVRLIVEREREIKNFKPQEYWSVEATLSKKDEDKHFKARLVKIDDKTIDRLAIKTGEEAKKIADELAGAEYKVAEITKKEAHRSPAPPFTTSTLQQEASRKLGFSAKQTMTLAQRLYETGHITYMRTDSLNIAQVALAQARDVITEKFGKEYALETPRFYHNKSKGAQEAHEAVRPTDLSKTPESLPANMDPGQKKLYELIWKRTLACQMAPAVLDQTAVDISAGEKYLFRANGQIIKFDGFIRAYTETRDEGDEDEEGNYAEGRLPDISKDELLKFIELLRDQHFTEPPPRFTDATLVKTLEAAGVGRPSTYAPTLATIQDRGYVEKIEKKYQPTEIGYLVNDMLVENFPEIVDINFTSHVEEEFDEIAEGKLGWVPVIREFWEPFSKNLKEKTDSVEKLIEVSDTPCPHCGKPMLIKFGRFGKFLACPEEGSKVTLPMPEEAAKIKELEEKTKDERCPICGKPMEVKRGRFGYFLGCVDYPQCKGIAKILNKTGFKCPNCLVGEIVEKKSRGRGKVFYACSRWPDCNFLMSKKPESEAELQEALKTWKEKPPKKSRGFKSKAKTTEDAKA
ncbi:MAG TPA: type I DNA topoisomerase [Candidatus Paceibacterota bacterium]|nr:type I DNA topoisomerase [Candidatus Paceibacterota bacterium]